MTFYELQEVIPIIYRAVGIKKAMVYDSSQATSHQYEMVALCCVFVLDEQALGKEFVEEPEELNRNLVVVVEGLGLKRPADTEIYACHIRDTLASNLETSRDATSAMHVGLAQRTDRIASSPRLRFRQMVV